MSRSHSTRETSSADRPSRGPRIVGHTQRQGGSSAEGAGRRPGRAEAPRGSKAATELNRELDAVLGQHLTPALKGWLLWDGEFVMGPRYIRLLEGIERHGSIRRACADLGLSYRTCLTRIRRMERVTGAAIVLTQRGGAIRGGAEVTPLGRRLVRAYRAWRDELEHASRRAFTRVMRE